MPTSNFTTFNEFSPTMAVVLPPGSGLAMSDYTSRLRNRSSQQLDDSGIGLSNPPFDTGAAGRIMNSLGDLTRRTDVRILRGYIRRSVIDNADPTSRYRLYFMFNPETIQRTYVTYLDQQALDPFNTIFGSQNLVAPPGVLNFSFELYFDRQAENANGTMPRGVLEDFDLFDLVIRGVVPDPQGPDLPDNGVLMVNPRNVTVVFSPQISVQGRPDSASVTYEKFDHRMRPIRMRINISMKAYYVGPVRQDFTFAQTDFSGNATAVVPYNETFKVVAVPEEPKAGTDFGPALFVSGQGVAGGFGSPYTGALPSGGVATGQALLDAAATFIGEPYSTAAGRTSPTSGYKDCSGLIVASYTVSTGRNLGATTSSAIWNMCNDQGLGIPRADALNIPGACLLMPEDPSQGVGDAGHIGFSDGNGGTIEATGSAVQRLSNTYQAWGSHACLLPGITYTRSH